MSHQYMCVTTTTTTTRARVKHRDVVTSPLGTTDQDLAGYQHWQPHYIIVVVKYDHLMTSLDTVSSQDPGSGASPQISAATPHPY